MAEQKGDVGDRDGQRLQAARELVDDEPPRLATKQPARAGAASRCQFSMKAVPGFNVWNTRAVNAKQVSAQELIEDRLVIHARLPLLVRWSFFVGAELAPLADRADPFRPPRGRT